MSGKRQKERDGGKDNGWDGKNNKRKEKKKRQEKEMNAWIIVHNSLIEFQCTMTI